MWWDPPALTGQRPFLPPGFEPGSHMIVWEGETDTMAAWQAAPPEAQKHMLGISGANAFGPKGLPPAEIEALFGQAKYVFFVFDNEDPYTNPEGAASVERGKAQIKAALGKKARFVRLPQGPQDAAEFFMTYDWGAFRVLLEQAMEHKFHYTPVDLTGRPPEYEWLVQDLLVRGDISLLSGDPGVGKSWLMYDLAIAVASGRETWLGMPLLRHGKVMIVDQENPLATTWQRLVALGMTPEVAKNIHLLWYAGVRMDQEEAALRFYEDAEHIEPELAIFDSLSRVHFKNENSAEEMNPLFNGGIYPLARNLRSTVGLVHHLSKEGKTRGSTAIKAAVDISLDMKNEETRNGAETGWQLVLPDKLRNVPPWGAALKIQRVTDEATGAVSLQTEEEVTAF